MSFDALTISGVLAALVSAGFIVAVVRNNDRRGSDEAGLLPDRASGDDAAR
jgi:hypothetical protein